jgi:hypothetical protein
MANNNLSKIGIVLLIAGIGLLLWGINLYGAFGNKFARTFTGASTNETMIFLIAGAICTTLGGIILYKK